MNIREELLKEHSLANSKRIAKYACAALQNLKELMDCFLSPEYRVAQRAAWAVRHVAKKNPELIQPYLKDLVAQLVRKDVHSAIIRNAVGILQDIEIPEKFHADVMNACFAFVEDPAMPVAIKAFSLTILNNLSKYYPEIKHELKLLIEARMDFETAAFTSRSKKILNGK